MPIFYLDSGSIDRLEVSSSLLVSGSFTVSGSMNTTGGLTGSLFGTASWATNAVSASYAPGGAGLSGGTTNSIPLWSSATTLTSSFIQQAGNTINTDGFVGGQKGLKLDFDNNIYQIGDYSTFAGNRMVIDSTNGLIGTYYYNGISSFSDGITLDQTNKVYTLGYNGISTGISWNLDGTTNVIKSSINNSDLGIKVDANNNLYSLGDFDNTTNGTFIKVDNSAGSQTVSISKNTIITGSLLATSGSGFLSQLTASEALAAGDFINIFSGGVRKASSDNTARQAHGFVASSYAISSSVTVLHSGLNPLASGLITGARYFLSASGAESIAPPITTGQLSQEVGVAVSSTSILVNLGPAIIT